MRKFILLFILGLIVGCADNKNESLKQENKELRHKNDSLMVLIDSLKQSKSFIYENEKQPLKGIFHLADTLILRHHNDNCGEWGGDEEIIKIYLKKDYKKGNEGDLFAFYQMNEYDCDILERNPYQTKPKVYFSGHKKLNYESAKIVEECIFDLLRNKLTNDNFIGNAGVINSIELKGRDAFLKDPLIFIYDYPSFSWEKFRLLKKELTK